MKYVCPLCTSDLKGLKIRKVSRPGESPFFALRWHLECPRCAGELMENKHPIERKVFPKLICVALLLNLLGKITGYIASGAVELAVLASSFLAIYAIMEFTIPKDWNRYVAWTEVPF